MYPLSVVSESYKMKESESESQEAHANAKAESAELTVTEGTTSGSKQNPTQFISVSKWLDHIVATKFPDMYKSELPKKRKIDEVDSDDKEIGALQTEQQAQTHHQIGEIQTTIPPTLFEPTDVTGVSHLAGAAIAVNL